MMMRLVVCAVLMAAGGLLAAVPQALAPTEGSSTIHGHPHLVWTAACEPKAAAMPDYEVQIARDAEFREVIDEDAVAAVLTRYVPAKRLTPGDYFWRVRLRHADGKCSAWSRATSFQVAPPAKVVPVPAGSSGARIGEIIRDAASSAPARVVFEKGDYRVDPGEALIDLQNARGLIIDGNGASVILTGRGSFVRLRECSDLEIRGFKVDYSPLPHIAGRVVATDEAKATIDLEVLPGYPLFEDAPRIADYEGGMVRNGDDFAMKNNQPLVVNTKPTFRRLRERVYRLEAAHPRRDFPAFSVGDVYVKGPRGPAGFDLENSSDIVVTDSTMFMCLGIGFSTHQVERLRILRVNLNRREGRPIAVQNGGHNHHDARIGPWVEDCLFEHTGDDICHVNGLLMMIREVRSPTEIVLAAGGGLEAGDRLQFYDKREGKLLGECVASAVAPGRRTVVVRLERPIAGLQAGEGSRKEYAGTQVYNADRQCHQFAWRNNRCIRGRRIGVLCKGRGGLVEGNLFQQLGGAAVDIWNAPVEGLVADGYVIRNNRILECGLVQGKGDSHSIRVFNRYGDSLLHRNILIEGNEIRDYPCRAITVRSATGVVIRGNRIFNAGFAGFRNEPGAIDVAHCADVILKGNTVDDVRALPGGPVRVEETTDFSSDR